MFMMRISEDFLFVFSQVVAKSTENPKANKTKQERTIESRRLLGNEWVSHSKLVRIRSTHHFKSGLMYLQCRVLICPVQCLGSINEPISQSIHYFSSRSACLLWRTQTKSQEAEKTPKLAFASIVKDSSLLLRVCWGETSIVFRLLDFKTSHKNRRRFQLGCFSCQCSKTLGNFFIISVLQAIYRLASENRLFAELPLDLMSFIQGQKMFSKNHIFVVFFATKMV